MAKLQPQLKPGMLVTYRTANSQNFTGAWVLRKFEGANDKCSEEWLCICTGDSRDGEHEVGDSETWTLSTSTVLRANQSAIAETVVMTRQLVATEEQYYQDILDA